MARILAISSFVAAGSIGLGAIVPVASRLGLSVTALPTVLFSTHPGAPHSVRQDLTAAALQNMMGALDAAGALHGLDGIITGYLPQRVHVAAAADAVRRVKALNPDALYLCDPIFGDDPKGLYLGQDVAGAIRDALLPMADILTPNRFELAWLTDCAVSSVAETLAAADRLHVPAVLATSVPAGTDKLANVLASGDDAWQATVPRLNGVPHGTGDMLSALFLGLSLKGHLPSEALQRATSILRAVVEGSVGQEALLISRLEDPLSYAGDPLLVLRAT